MAMSLIGVAASLIEIFIICILARPLVHYFLTYTFKVLSHRDSHYNSCGCLRSFSYVGVA
jgi:hypothetical protein